MNETRIPVMTLSDRRAMATERYSLAWSKVRRLNQFQTFGDYVATCIKYDSIGEQKATIIE